MTLSSQQTPGPDHSSGKTNWKPTRKWVAGVASGALATGGLAALEALDEVDIPGPWGSVVGLVVAFGIAYLRPNKPTA